MCINEVVLVKIAANYGFFLSYENRTGILSTVAATILLFSSHEINIPLYSYTREHNQPIREYTRP